LAQQNKFSSQANKEKQTEGTSQIDVVATAKKKFVEPELSNPVDVLEATTFFQAASSGVTN
jgi:hypothetical protein